MVSVDASALDGSGCLITDFLEDCTVDTDLPTESLDGSANFLVVDSD